MYENNRAARNNPKVEVPMETVAPHCSDKNITDSRLDCLQGTIDKTLTTTTTTTCRSIDDPAVQSHPPTTAPEHQQRMPCLILFLSITRRPSFEDSVESGLYIFCSIKWIRDPNGHRWSSLSSPSIATDRLANDANVISEGGDP